MSLSQPTDAELDVMIRSRLASIGIDLEQLPAGSTPDPETGSPGRDSVLASLRGFVRTTVLPLSSYTFATDARLAQQAAPPKLYPSIDVVRES
ncbi:hypothetical protein [Kribbella sp. HUAS MG21]|uniref:Uncharacterized protein n=1 Tax=Kribbella sp. HUAS MG21 TaxID=3160966 RepID=A0AAU7TEM4_9ACTN